MADGKELLDKLFGAAGGHPEATAGASEKLGETKKAPTEGAKATEAERPKDDPRAANTGKQPEAATTKPKKGEAAAPGDKPEPKGDHEDAGSAQDGGDVATMSEAERGKHEAMLAERGKRQDAEKRAEALEQRLAAIEQRISASQQTAAAPPPEKPGIETTVDFWGNPLEQTDAQARRIYREEARMALWQTTSAAARSAHQDFDAVAKQFEAEIGENSYLHGWWSNQANPAEALYDYMTRIKPALANGSAPPANGGAPTAAGTGGNQQPGTVDVDAIRAQARAEVQQELVEKRASEAARGQPQSQAGARGSGAAPGRTAASGEQLLERMFSNRR